MVQADGNTKFLQQEKFNLQQQAINDQLLLST